MTVYSKSKEKNNNKIVLSKSGIFYVNLSILSLVGFAIFGYVYTSNYSVSHQFSVEKSRVQLEEMTSSVAMEQTALTRSQDLSSLLSFAQRSGMVEGSGEKTLYVNSGVAFSDAQSFEQ